jgi:hypothetical protein
LLHSYSLFDYAWALSGAHGEANGDLLFGVQNKVHVPGNIEDLSVLPIVGTVIG